jgi:LysR family transcriptional regulator, cell division regulator
MPVLFKGKTMEPSSSDLRYFLEVVNSGNMSKAASKIGISQPSLSLAIQRIEKSLGEIILLRDRTGARPTRAGEVLLKKSKMVIEAWEELKFAFKEESEKGKGALIIGCHPEVAIDSLPLFMPIILEKYPNLEITLQHDISRNITQQVIEGRVDIGLVVNPRPYPDLIIRTLSYDEMGLWYKKGMSLNKKNPPCLICHPDLTQSHKITRAAKKSGLNFGKVITSTDIEVICALAASGCGVAILPSEVALRNPAHNLVKMSGSPVVKDKVALVYRQENKSSNLFSLVTKEIKDGHENKYGKMN